MRNFISILLLTILLILTPVMFIVTSLRVNILTADFLKQELVRVDAYGLASSQIDEQIAKVKIDPQYPITNAELASLSHSIISAAWLRQNVERLFDGMEQWLESEPGTVLSLPIDLRQPKQSLTTGVDQLLAEKLPQLQPCPDPRVPKEEQGICQFAGLTLPQLKEQLSRQGLNPDLVNQAFPDTLDLANPDLSKITGPEDGSDPNSAPAKSAEIKKRLEEFKARYQQIDFLLNLALAIYGLVILLYLAINGVRGWHRLAHWGGMLLLILGVILFGMALASLRLIEVNILPNIHFAPSTPVELARVVPEAIRDVRAALFNPLLYTGITLLVFGIGALIVAHRIPAASKTKQA